MARQIQIRKPTQKPKPDAPDTRTPSGKPMPF